MCRKKEQKEPALFQHTELTVKPKDHPEHLDINAMYQRATEELTLQQSKRDQLLMIYMAAFAFIVPALISEEGLSPALSGSIFIGLGFIGLLFSLIVIRYRKYKESYWICCRTLTVMMTMDKSAWTEKNIQAIYYKCLCKKAGKYVKSCEKKPSGKRFQYWKYSWENLNSGETLYLVILALIAGSVLGMGVGILLPLTMKLKVICGIASGCVLCAAAIYQYFKTLAGVYSVCADGLERSFNTPFKDAWFLHFFVDSSPNDQDNTPKGE